MNFDEKLKRLAKVTVEVGLNVQPGQQLLIWAPLETANFVHEVARAAYRAGAEYVDVNWRDEQLRRIRFEEAPKDTFEIIPQWFYDNALEHRKQGDALLSIKTTDPDLLDGIDPDLIQTSQKASSQAYRPIQAMGNLTNWCVVCPPTPAWARKVFPDLSTEDAVNKLWNVIFDITRVAHDDPITAWENHIANLNARKSYLNDRQYTALKYKGPGTDFTLGLPADHLWKAARSKTRSGTDYVANVPTEEVYTLPDRSRADGVISSTRPLNHAGVLMDNFSLTFRQGRVVEAHAKVGHENLQRLLQTDEGASRLGEVALVPHSSPISQSGITFYNTLYDENASSHVALGRAYRETMKGGDDMTDEEFEQRGGNDSLIHVDFMVGSDELDINGVRADGSLEPVMRSGEWAFDV
jgi:aminopeptidase